ncbi:MAG: hypothetical protein EOO61_03725 [Hymenobacter sp.]|nr:MAG: hypothetical protein EOO61_03725 [Hymenobacter sp.]
MAESAIFSHSMALDYRILFSDSAPVLPDFLYQLPAIVAARSSVMPEEHGWLLVDEQQEIALRISASEKADYLDFVFGPYHYQSSWYVRFNTPNRFRAQQLLLEVFKQLAVVVESNFLAVFNGELVILRKEGRQVYLNSLSGTWDTTEALAVLAPVAYTLAEYPVY